MRHSIFNFNTKQKSCEILSCNLFLQSTENVSLCLSLFKHYLTMIGAIVSIPFILTPALCMENEDPARGLIISTMIFVTGLVTFVQATWGCRLPIVQVNNTKPIQY